MSQQTSEEKTLPASDKKLRDARKKGQVARSQDLVSGVDILVASVFLAVSVTSIEGKLEALIDVASRVYTEPFAGIWPQLVAGAIQILMWIVVPLLFVVISATLVTNIGVMEGLVFSADPLAPKFEKINPVAGFKRIFSMRGIVEFFKGLFKVAILGCTFVIVFRIGMQSLFNSSACGASCISPTFYALLKPIVVSAVIAFLFVGVIDVMLQRWLFRREQKMTKTERKRELRDTEGDPQIRQQRKRLRNDMQKFSVKTGLMNATILIGGPDGWTSGIRYVRGETPVPMTVCRADPEQARTMITQALLADILVVQNLDLGEAIARRSAPGSPIPESTFAAVADILVGARLI